MINNFIYQKQIRGTIEYLLSFIINTTIMDTLKIDESQLYFFQLNDTDVIHLKGDQIITALEWTNSPWHLWLGAMCFGGIIG